MVMEVLDNENLKADIRSRKFRLGQLQVEIVMCDNFKGWGNFSSNALGIPSNICLPHGTGKMTFFS